VRFDEELSRLLPPDLPHRGNCIAKAARHLELIVEANRHFNLTRIVDPREAAIKHVLDSILPWRLFAAAASVADAGTGPGFPGIPLAIVLPETRFVLLESTQKKARFVDSVIGELDLPNVEVYSERAESWLASNRVDIVTARAVAPLDRALAVFSPALKRGSRVLLYKGPGVESETNRGIKITILERYNLPDSLGSRAIVSLKAM
jgi:16S rRNA (guanine527-N7)-methyltransferase